MKTPSIVLGLSVMAACAAARKSDPGGQGGDAPIASASASGSSAGGSGGVQESGSGHSSASIVGVGTGAGGGEKNPGSCLVTCTNHAPNHEPGCDLCMISVCSLEYDACAADKGDGGTCIRCSDLLAQGGNGIDCDTAADLMTALLACVCSKGTCD